MLHKSLVNALKMKGIDFESKENESGTAFNYTAMGNGYVLKWVLFTGYDEAYRLKMVRAANLAYDNPVEDFCSWFFPKTLKDIISCFTGVWS